jgi:hypothetical protein|tara:strand:- start:7255 stop:7746 length:492 start_codon:yes stop_codon:yes gene_type:complete
MLDFANLIKGAIDFGADFLLGEETYDDDAVNVASTKSRSGGFLDTLRGGLKKTMEQGEAREEQQQQLRHRSPPGTRVGSRPAFQAERMSRVNPLLNNPAAQRAFRNLQNRAYANNDMNRIGRELRVALTRRQGQRTIGVEPARAPKVTRTAAANVRKEPKAVT